MKPYICTGPISAKLWYSKYLELNTLYWLDPTFDLGYDVYDADKKPILSNKNGSGMPIWLSETRLKIFTPSHHEFDNALEKLLDE